MMLRPDPSTNPTSHRERLRVGICHTNHIQRTSQGKSYNLCHLRVNSCAWLSMATPKTKCLGWSDGSSNSVVESQLWCERNILEDVPKIGQKSKWNSLTPNWSSSAKLHLCRLCKVCCLFLKKTPTPQTALCAPYPCPISHPPWCTVTDPSEPQKTTKVGYASTGFSCSDTWIPSTKQV